MSADPAAREPVAREVVRAPVGSLAGAVGLAHHARALRRRRLVTEAGQGLLVDLPATTAVEEGDAFRLADGRLVGVLAEPEPLLEARASPGDLPRLAWHVGNRHAPCELGDGWLRVPADRPMAAMLQALGAEVREVTAPFHPEGGAYGTGTPTGHAHSHGDHDHGA